MMDFEGIEKVRQRVRQNGTLAQQLAEVQRRLEETVPGEKTSGPQEDLRTRAMAKAMKE